MMDHDYKEEEKSDEEIFSLLELGNFNDACNTADDKISQLLKGLQQKDVSTINATLLKEWIQDPSHEYCYGLSTHDSPYNSPLLQYPFSLGNVATAIFIKPLKSFNIWKG
jgi:hypothetical protein